MSHYHNQVTKTWSAVEDFLSQLTSFEYEGQPIGTVNTRVYADALMLWYLASYDILQPDGTKSIPLLRKWLNHIVQVDVKDLIDFLSALDSTLITQNSKDYESFKHSLKEINPSAGILLIPVRRHIALWFQTQEPEHFAVVHGWACFIGRVNLKGFTPLIDKAIMCYLEGEKNLKRDGFTLEESDLITTWYPRSLELEHFFKDKFQPQHGPKSTADAGKNLLQKYLKLGKDARIKYLDSQLGEKGSYPRPPVEFLRRAKLVLVAKSLKTYRTISMEPSTLMWYQQGVLKAFNADLKHRRFHPLRTRYSPMDQQPNRDLAWEGSVDGSFATIDLSSASDSVSWPLVKAWFRESCLYRWMLCTRSFEVQLPDGTVQHVDKFAPMGSALCFPTEVVVFCAITECAIKEAGGDPNRSRYRVFGDDIVVESKYAPFVMSRLERNGFSVNTQKSYSTTDLPWIFRESCGGEYLDGADVTPVRLSRRFSGLKTSVHRASQIESLIEMANDCYSRYPSVRTWCVRSLLRLKPHVGVLFNSTGDGGLFSTQPTNWHLIPPVWSQDLQTFLIRHGHHSVRYRGHRDLEVEDIRLFECLRQIDGRPTLLLPEDRVLVDLRPLEVGTWASSVSPM